MFNGALNWLSIKKFYLNMNEFYVFLVFSFVFSSLTANVKNHYNLLLSISSTPKTHEANEERV